MYSLVMVLVLAGYLLVTNALERPTAVRLIGIALLTGALLLTHYWAMWLLAATFAVLAWRAWRSAPERGPTVRVLVAMAAGGVFLRALAAVDALPGRPHRHAVGVSRCDRRRW